MYVANSGSDKISVFSLKNNTKINNIDVGTKIEDVPVRDHPADIDINKYFNMIYVTNFYGNMSVIYGTNNTTIKEIRVGGNPAAIDVSDFTDQVFVADGASDVISVINGSSITKIKEIRVGDNPTAIGFNEKTKVVYVANQAVPWLPPTNNSNSISVISAIKHEKIADDIAVGRFPISLGINELTNLVYVANSGDDSVSVIAGENNTKIKDIPVGDKPVDIAVNEDTNTVYVVNYGSNSISVIDGVNNEVVARVILQIDPFNAGFIECDELIAPTGQYVYVASGTECIAKPNKGFELLSWKENLEDNSTQVIKVVSPTSNTIFNYIADTLDSMVNFLGIQSNFDSFTDFFGIKSEESESILNITKFGSFRLQTLKNFLLQFHQNSGFNHMFLLVLSLQGYRYQAL